MKSVIYKLCLALVGVGLLIGVVGLLGSCGSDDPCPMIEGPYCWVGGLCCVPNEPDYEGGCVSCNPDRSIYEFTAKADGTPCDDMDTETEGDICQSGKCTGYKLLTF